MSEGLKEREPLVAVVIPNRNGLFHLEYSLPALTASLYSRVFYLLVDDGSTDGSVEFVRREFPQVQALSNRKGRGFAGSANTGIGYALDLNADYIAIANTDIRIGPRWIEPVLAVLEREDKVGLVGFTEIPREKEEVFDKNRDVKAEHTLVTGVPGCLFVCPASVFMDVGFFDEEYFMYGEDNDFFARLIKRGYRIVQTNIPVWHFNEGSGQRAKFANAWLTYRNGIRYALKNEAIPGIIRRCGALLYYGCSPFPFDRAGNPSLNRLRRYNILANLALFMSACGWNMLHLAGTLSLRFRGVGAMNHPKARLGEGNERQEGKASG